MNPFSRVIICPSRETILGLGFRLEICGGPYLQTQQTLFQTQHGIIEAKQTVSETQHSIIEAQHNIIETQHRIIETHHNIIETQHSIIQTQHNIMEAQAFCCTFICFTCASVVCYLFSTKNGKILKKISNQLHSSHKTFFPSKMANKNGGKLQSMSAVAVADPREGPDLI